MGSSVGTAVKARDSSHLDDVDEAAAFATSGGSVDTDLSSRVELHIECQKLKKKIAACAIVYTRRSQDPKWHEIGKTETIFDTKAPTFVKSVILDYNFEIQQKVRVELYNITKAGDPNMSAQEYIGFAEGFVGEIVASRTSSLVRTLTGVKSPNVGEALMSAEELSRVKHQCSFTMRASGLPVMDFFSRNADPYAIVYRTHPKDETGERSVPVYRTEVIKRSLKPQWQKIEISVQQLCRGEESRPVRIEIWDWNRTQQHSFIGEVETSYADLHRAFQDERPLVLQLYNNRKKGAMGKKKYEKGPGKAAGQLILEDINVSRQYSFLDYVYGGLEIGLIVAIDMTRSNGDPRNEDSLHYYDTSQPNDYVMAMRAVGEILQHYDADNKYPVLGFGAKVPPSHTVCSHCFSLNGNIFDPEVEGLDNIIKVYRKALSAVSLHGPTHFHEVIQYAANMAKPYSNPAPGDDQKYFILMIVADGVINDMQQTIDEVVRGSETPLSIIIVGVGDEDFSMMDELDADDRPLYSVSEKKYMSRDIVQFVPFNEFKDKSYHQLAMATLDEIPREVVNYFLSRKITPKRVDNVSAIMPNRALRDAGDANEDGGPSAPDEKDDSSIPRFLREEKHRLLQGAISQGYPRDDVEEVLDRCGLPAASAEMLLDVLTNGEKGVNAMTAANQEYLAFEKNNRPSKHGMLVRQATGGNWGEQASGSGGGSKARSNLPGGIEEDDNVDRPPENRKDHAKPANLGKKKKNKSNKDGDDDMAQLCKVCFEKPIDTVILECGHQIVCDGCSKQIGSLCPLCRQTITKICRTFVS
eukprot:gnl/MRDRNA2_/MRDRNA2_120223_c0_seq1.p1 gnl/MRDRNA2_/MRDRNA2_120223_c0~~gnl/MRDRNA2_/MRDRNA2_120223_c0_seq1.p1  ORF type:complete len:810 (+),score=147.23 gnl/MRDRNA2_/MRDRNA2_120223_c0_seq1:113-2542(+)